MNGPAVATLCILRKTTILSISATLLFLLLYHLASNIGDMDCSYAVFIVAASMSSVFSISMIAMSKWIDSGWMAFVSSSSSESRRALNSVFIAALMPLLLNCSLMVVFSLIIPQASYYIISGIMMMAVLFSLLTALSMGHYSSTGSSSVFQYAALASPVLGMLVIFAYVFRIIVPNGIFCILLLIAFMTIITATATANKFGPGYYMIREAA